MDRYKVIFSETWCLENVINISFSLKTIIEPPTGLGTEEVGPIAATWPYFERMHRFCSERHNINPPLIVNTGNEENRPSTSASTSNSSASSSSSHKKRKCCEIDEEEKKTVKIDENSHQDVYQVHVKFGCAFEWE